MRTDGAALDELARDSASEVCLPIFTELFTDIIDGLSKGNDAHYSHITR